MLKVACKSGILILIGTLGGNPVKKKLKDAVNIRKKFSLFNEYWTPKVLGELNGNYIKIFKSKGEFVWHSHENEDECFLVFKGLFGSQR